MKISTDPNYLKAIYSDPRFQIFRFDRYASELQLRTLEKFDRIASFMKLLTVTVMLVIDGHSQHPLFDKLNAPDVEEEEEEEASNKSKEKKSAKISKSRRN